jgi:hypothetical protein
MYKQAKVIPADSLAKAKNTINPKRSSMAINFGPSKRFSLKVKKPRSFSSKIGP